MRTVLAALLLTSTAAGAGAATIGSGAGQVGVGGSFTVYFNGIIEGAVQSGLTSEITFEVTSIDTSTNTIALDYSITNTSSDPVTFSRVSAFGFNSTPDLADNGAVITGVFWREHYDRNVPQLGTTFEFCGNNNIGNSCSGGGFSGVTIGNTGGGTLTLTFGSSIAGGAELTDFFVRYQSIYGVTCGQGSDWRSRWTDCSGVGVSTPPIPEPAAMAVFGVGALIVGAALRKRALA
jgi:hypothetical protein